MWCHHFNRYISLIDWNTFHRSQVPIPNIRCVPKLYTHYFSIITNNNNGIKWNRIVFERYGKINQRLQTKETSITAMKQNTHITTKKLSPELWLFGFRKFLPYPPAHNTSLVHSSQSNENILDVKFAVLAIVSYSNLLPSFIKVGKGDRESP